MRLVVLSLVTIILFGIQSALARSLGWVSVSVDIPLLAVVYLGATSPGLDGFITAVFIGLLTDAFIPGGLLGAHMEVMGIIFLIARGLADRLQVVHALPLMVMVLVCFMVKTFLLFVLSVVFDREFSQYSAVFFNALPQAFATVLLAPLFVAMFRWAEQRLSRRRTGWTSLR